MQCPVQSAAYPLAHVLLEQISKGIFMKISALLVFLILCAARFSFASYTLTDNRTGATYACGSGGSSPGAYPSCVSEVTSFCNSNTGYDRTKCFDKATEACTGSNSNTASCIAQTSAYCNSNTGYDRTKCFDKSILSCRGNHLTTLQLMEKVRSHNVDLQKALFNTQLKSFKQQE